MSCSYPSSAIEIPISIPFYLFVRLIFFFFFFFPNYLLFCCSITSRKYVYLDVCIFVVHLYVKCECLFVSLWLPLILTFCSSKNDKVFSWIFLIFFSILLNDDVVQRNDGIIDELWNCFFFLSFAHEIIVFSLVII